MIMRIIHCFPVHFLDSLQFTETMNTCKIFYFTKAQVILQVFLLL